jgi:hypothetical protein
MSNRVEPKLNTQLDILPKENIIIPLDIRSVRQDSFPNMQTPKLQPLNQEIISYPGLRGNKPTKKNKKIKDKKVFKPIVIRKCNNLIDFFIIFLKTLMIVAITYTILLYVNNSLIN